MSRSVTFNGQTKFKPGGITRIDASALNRVTTSENGVVFLIGEAEGGPPGQVVEIFDPVRASDFRSGRLVDAARVAFQPSNDPLVPGGASRILLYKTNDSTKSSLNIPGASAVSLISGTATGGSTTTVVDSGLSGPGPSVGDWMVIRRGTATAEARQITEFDGGTGTFTVAPVFASAATAADEYDVFSDSVELLDIVDASSTTSSIVLQDGSIALDGDFVGQWLLIDDGVTPRLRRITSSTAATDTLVVSPVLPSAPATGSILQILPDSALLESRDWGLHTNDISLDVSAGLAGTVVTVSFEGRDEISPELGTGAAIQIVYVGAPADVSDTVGPAPSTSVIPLVTGGLTPSAHVGQQVEIEGQFSVVTANTADSLTIAPALLAPPAPGADVTITDLMVSSYAEVQGQAGVAQSLAVVLDGVAGDNLSLSFVAGETLRQLVSRINANPNYQAVVAPGVNPDTRLVADLDFGAASRFGVAVSSDLTGDGAKRAGAEFIEYLNAFSEYVQAVRPRGIGISSYAGAGAPNITDAPAAFSGAIRGVSANSSFQAGFDAALQRRANSTVPLMDQDLIEEGLGSTATLSSVAAQLRDHVAIARGAAQEIAGERGGYIGFLGNRSQLAAFARAMNDYDVAVCGQSPVVLNAAGTLQTYGPWMQAVIAAGMRAGVFEIAEPLTAKQLRVSGLSQDASWSPNDLTDQNTLIQAGVLFAQTNNGVTKWVRDLTSWTSDDNLAFIEGSTRDAVRYVAYDLRSGLVARFTGRKALRPTIANVKEAAATILEQMRSDNIIVDSFDAQDGSPLRAWYNLKVFSSGDTVRLSVCVFPVVGINFILNDIYLQLPIQAA